MVITLVERSIYDGIDKCLEDMMNIKMGGGTGGRYEVDFCRVFVTKNETIEIYIAMVKIGGVRGSAVWLEGGGGANEIKMTMKDGGY